MMLSVFTFRAARFSALGAMLVALFTLAACLEDMPDSRPGPTFAAARPGAWAQPALPNVARALNAAFAEARALPGSTALTVAVRSGAHGHWQASAPARAERFWWASAGKLVTTMLALQEVDAGRLSLDAPLAQTEPLVPPAITLRQLLGHTSGIADFSNPDLLAGRSGPVAHRALIRAALDRPREFAPGAGWAYSNTGFLLIEQALQRVSGQSYTQLVRSRIARPLGLSSLAAPTSVPADLTLPALGKPRPASEYPPNIGGAGSVVATAADMARFWQAAMAGDLVDPALMQAAITTLRPMFHDDAMQMGAGIILFPASDGSGYWLGHGGGADRVGALVLYSPSRQLVLAIAGIGPEVQAMEIANLFIKALDKCGAESC